VHRAAKLVSLKNSLKLPKLLDSSSVQVSQDLFLASEGVFHTIYGGHVKEKSNPTSLPFLKKLLPRVCIDHFGC